MSYVDIWKKSILDIGRVEVGVCLVCWKNCKKVSVVGVELSRWVGGSKKCDLRGNWMMVGLLVNCGNNGFYFGWNWDIMLYWVRSDMILFIFF